jgi:hypothetical protein
VAQLRFERFPGHLVGPHPGPHSLGEDVVAAEFVDDGTLNPGGRVGGELEATGRIKSFDGVDQAELPERTQLLDRLEGAQSRCKSTSDNFH